MEKKSIDEYLDGSVERDGGAGIISGRLDFLGFDLCGSF